MAKTDRSAELVGLRTISYGSAAGCAVLYIALVLIGSGKFVLAVATLLPFLTAALLVNAVISGAIASIIDQQADWRYADENKARQ